MVCYSELKGLSVPGLEHYWAVLPMWLKSWGQAEGSQLLPGLALALGHTFRMEISLGPLPAAGVSPGPSAFCLHNTCPDSVGSWQ